MSYAPTNQTNQTWYNPKNNGAPAYPGAVPQIYDPNVVQPQAPPIWNQQQPYWQSNPPNTSLPSRPLSANQGSAVRTEDNSWSWSSKQHYEPHQQSHQQFQQPQYNQSAHTPYHPISDQYFCGNAEDQPQLNSISDPWNWGVEESSSSDCMSNNNMDSGVDPTWNWSVENTTVHHRQQPPSELPPSQTPPVSSHQESFSVSSSSQSYGNHDEVSNVLQHQPEVKAQHSSMPLSSSNDGGGSGQKENVNHQHTSNHQLQPALLASHFVTEPIDEVKDNISTVESSVPLETPGFNTFEYHERLNTTEMTNQVMMHVSTEAVIQDTHTCTLSSNVSEVRLEKNGTEPRSEPQQFVPSELSVSSVMRHDQQVMAADGLLNELDFSVTSKHSSTGLTPQWSTESLPSQGSDELSHTLEGGSSYDLMPSPLSTVSQSPCLIDGSNYDQNQFDSYSSIYHNASSPAWGGGPMADINITPALSCGQEHTLAASSQVVENINHQMAGLNIDTNKPKLEDVDNNEIVPPELNAKVTTLPMVNSFMAPPLVQAPPSGPSKTPPVSAPTSGPPKTMSAPPGNPYARSKTLLSHKLVSKYQTPTSSGDTLSLTSPIVPSIIMQPVDIPTDRALFDINVAEPVAGIDRSRISVTAEHDVNLETLPDNKERPDVVESSLERKSMSPRTNTPATGQDSNARQWMQPSAYNISPENQEVAPRCGPDRNQYLETGQLSDDEEASEVSQYRLRETGSWSGLQRMVPGQITEHEAQAASQGSTGASFSDYVSTPPPGLHRMIPGQTEQDNLAAGEALLSSQDTMLQRMVPGRLTNEDAQGFNTDERNTAAGEENPPPGLRRMVPGESSSPESQSQGVRSSQPGSASFQPIAAAPIEARVVTGVSRDETNGHTNANSRSPSPAPIQPSVNKTQPTAERSETIGSDSVETYPQQHADTTSREINNRRENPKDRDRRHREDDPIDERDSRRRANHSYRDRDRGESPSGGRFEQEKSSHRNERDPHDRQGDGERDRRPADRKDRHNMDSGYDRKRRDRDRPKSTKERSRREESPESRRYREDRLRDRKHYDAREGYGSYRPSRTADERRRYGRRADYRNSDTGSEYSDYERHGYDRRDRENRERPSYRGHEDYTARYNSSRQNRTHYDGNKIDRVDKMYREKRDHRPESREQTATQFVPPRSGFHALKGRSIAEYMNYYSQLRSYDAVVYADWYHNVYKNPINQQATYSEDRGSVHSGRSSANSGIYQGEREIGHCTNSLTEDYSATSPHRLTPSKFSTAHVKGVLTNHGQVIKILPNYPLDGHKGIVEIHDVQGFMVSNKVRSELTNFPGPLVKGITHKNTLISFCNYKIKSAENNHELFDRESVILLWKLLGLLLRQNGVVVGADIAELLLSHDHSFVANPPARPSASSTPASHKSREDIGLQPDEVNVTSKNRATFNSNSEEEITNSFREILLFGNTKGALEWAMQNGLWGHALFLASKMDTRTYSNVMTRFANGLSMNDPLQTLYQIMSGRQPASVTCCSDEQWGDWRPHLAMILSNSSAQRLELTHKSITTLGDTLGSRGCLHAAHFTYLVAQVNFGTYAQKDVKLVLLGSTHHQPFEVFANNESIQMTEIYEYSRKLAEPDYALKPLQFFKLIYAKRLAEQGLVAEAMQYAEELGDYLLRHPEQYRLNLMRDVYDLGDSLKYNDPLYNCGVQDGELHWLVRLNQVISDIDSGVIQDVLSHGSVSNLSYTEVEASQNASIDPQSGMQEVSYDYNWQHQQQQQLDNQHQQYTPRMYIDSQQEMGQEHNQHPQQLLEEKPNEMQDAFQPATVGQMQPPQQEWPTTPQSISQWDTQGNSTMLGDNNQNHQEQNLQQPYSNYWDQSTTHEELPAPQISLPNSVPQRSRKIHESDEQTKPTAKSNQKKDAPLTTTGSSWFGGIWNKLALRPKNQMKLPDDKNPTIVWDSDRKRWTNLDADGEETSNAPPPPPRSSAMMPNSIPSGPTLQPAPTNHNSGEQPQPQPTSLPPPTTSNIYKMNRGRSLRSNYVDILGGNKFSNQSQPAPPDMFPPVAAQQSQTNFLVPGMPVEVTETAPTEHMPSNPVPNGSPEPTLKNYDTPMQGGETQQPSYGVPLMYNPNNFAQPIPYAANPTSNHFNSRYPH